MCWSYRHFQVLLLVGVLLLSAGGQVNGAVAAEPMVQMRETVDQILAVLRNEELPAEEKKERVLQAVQARFDFREMSKSTLARHWQRISPGEQEQFVDRFSQLLENNYIGRVQSYSGEEVIFKDQAVRNDKAVVSSIVVQQQSGTEIPISYRLQNQNGEWLVYDVVIEGVSLVRNYRSQFRSILDREKFSGLLKRIEEKIQEQKES